MLEKLEAIRAAIVEKHHWRSGVIDVDPENLVLFYGKDHEARRIDFNSTTIEELDHLANTCDPVVSSAESEDVLNGICHKAGKLDSKFFSSNLNIDATGLLAMAVTDILEGGGSEESFKDARTKVYKLNIHGKDSFFKGHEDTPRGERMFGSLVIIFQTPHEGGSLIVRTKEEEWVFNSAQAVTEHEGPCVGYIAFYGDVEHEVTPVTAGYRVTLTYRLYHAPTSKATFLHQRDDARDIYRPLKALLADSLILPYGGCLGFGLNREYPIPRGYSSQEGYEFVIQNLKGSDAALIRALEALSFVPHYRVAISTQSMEKNDSYILAKNFSVGDNRIDIRAVEDSIQQAIGRRQLNPRWATRIYRNRDSEDDFFKKREPPLEILWVTRPEDHTTLSSPVIGDFDLARERRCVPHARTRAQIAVGIVK